MFMKKSMKITISIVVAFFVAIGLFAIIWFNGKNYKQLYAKANEEFSIPGLKAGYVPQGLAYYENGQCFLSAGYMKDGSPSRIYVIGEEDTKYFTLKLGDTDYVGHAGGIATYGNLGYLVGDKQLYIFNIADAVQLEDGESIDILAHFDAPNGADFINIQNNLMYIGEFYHETKYPTSEAHHISSADGKNYAVTFVYTIQAPASGNIYGFDITSPEYAISTTEKIQGMCINGEEGEILLSSSWSLADSKIYIHNKLSEITPSKFKYNDRNIDIFILDSSNLKETLTLPSMSEEITYKDGRIYVIFENACAKYKMVTRHKNTKAISFEVSKMLGEDEDK